MAEILGLGRVGINDNFFELGGDSIRGIQAVARANRAGFTLTPRQLFQHQTIAALASAAGDAPVLHAEQGVVTGTVPLTPVQHWFFEMDLPDPHHFNQSVMLEARGGLNLAALEESVRLLLAHHDALRLRFARTESGWQQFHAAAADEPAPVSLVVLPSATVEEYRAAVSAAAAEAQATLNLFHGPLMRVTAFRSEAGLPERLHVAVHHLAVDGVSWRVLLEDWATVTNNSREARLPDFPPDNFISILGAAALRLRADGRRAAGGRLLADASGDFERAAANRLRGRRESGRAGSARTVSVSLDAEATAGLLYDAPRSFRVQVNEVLLTALARSFARWTANNSLLVCVESHGRQDIFGDVDFSRTVGWFTALFPVRLTLPNDPRPGEQLKTIKEHLRRVPNHGIGYGLLRYLCRDAQTARSVSELGLPRSFIQLLSNFDQALPDASPFRLCDDDARDERGPDERRDFLFEINAHVAGGRLVSNWSYDPNLHRRETVEALAEGFTESVRLLTDYCRGAGTTAGYTPSDFPKSKLNQSELDHLLSKIGASRGETA